MCFFSKKMAYFYRENTTMLEFYFVPSKWATHFSWWESVLKFPFMWSMPSPEICFALLRLFTALLGLSALVNLLGYVPSQWQMDHLHLQG